jgi:hypothetical protein
MSVGMHPDRDAARPRPGWLQPGLVLPEGLEAGLIGGFVVVLTFWVRDVSMGQPLHTPAVLGTLLLDGAVAAQGVQSDATAAVAYNGVHFALWTALGFLGSWITARVQVGAAPRWLPLALLLVSLCVLVVLDGVVSATRLTRLWLWTGGLAGLGAMGAFLAWRHPGGLGLRPR